MLCCVPSIGDNVIPIERDLPQSSTTGSEDPDHQMDTEDEVPLYEGIVNEDDLATIVCAMEEVTKVMAGAEYMIAQPRRGLPAKVQFQVKFAYLKLKDLIMIFLHSLRLKKFEP